MDIYYGRDNDARRAQVAARHFAEELTLLGLSCSPLWIDIPPEDGAEWEHLVGVDILTPLSRLAREGTHEAAFECLDALPQTYDAWLSGWRARDAAGDL